MAGPPICSGGRKWQRNSVINVETRSAVKIPYAAIAGLHCARLLLSRPVLRLRKTSTTETVLCLRRISTTETARCLRKISTTETVLRLCRISTTETALHLRRTSTMDTAPHLPPIRITEAVRRLPGIHIMQETKHRHRRQARILVRSSGKSQSARFSSGRWSVSSSRGGERNRTING